MKYMITFCGMYLLALMLVSEAALDGDVLLVRPRIDRWASAFFFGLSDRVSHHRKAGGWSGGAGSSLPLNFPVCAVLTGCLDTTATGSGQLPTHQPLL